MLYLADNYLVCDTDDWTFEKVTDDDLMKALSLGVEIKGVNLINNALCKSKLTEVLTPTALKLQALSGIQVTVNGMGRLECLNSDIALSINLSDVCCDIRNAVYRGSGELYLYVDDKLKFTVKGFNYSGFCSWVYTPIIFNLDKLSSVVTRRFFFDCNNFLRSYYIDLDFFTASHVEAYYKAYKGINYFGALPECIAIKLANSPVPESIHKILLSHRGDIGALQDLLACLAKYSTDKKEYFNNLTNLYRNRR
jgi:hypothetical protein